MKNHILLFSGWQTINIGDIGHTPGTLRYFEQYLPEAKVTVALQRETTAERAMLERRFPRVKFMNGTIHPDGSFSSGEIECAFEESSLIVQNSGMIYNSVYPPKPGLCIRAISAGKAFGFYGQSFDGFSDGDRNVYFEYFKHAAFIYCRDSISQRYLKENGCKAPIIEFGPDGCFGIDVRDEEKAQAYLRSSGLQEGKFLVVVLRTNTKKSEGRPHALDPDQPTPEQIREDEERSAKMNEVITDYVRLTKRKVLLAPEVDKEIEHAKRLILDRLSEDVLPYVVWRNAFWNVDEAASVLARAELLVAMEPHSCIIALRNGVPSIHYYTIKHGVKAEMFADIGLREWLIDIDTTNAKHVSVVVNDIISDRDRALKKVQNALDFVDKRSASICKTIWSILKTGQDDVRGRI